VRYLFQPPSIAFPCFRGSACSASLLPALLSCFSNTLPVPPRAGARCPGGEGFFLLLPEASGADQPTHLEAALQLLIIRFECVSCSSHAGNARGIAVFEQPVLSYRRPDSSFPVTPERRELTPLQCFKRPFHFFFERQGFYSLLLLGMRSIVATRLTFCCEQVFGVPGQDFYLSVFMPPD